MKILSFKAKRIYGYLDFDLAFNPDLNFLIGINGAGKTTILRLVVALLSPSFRVLDEIPHESAELSIKVGRKRITIKSKAELDGTTLSVTGVKLPLTFPLPDIRQFQDRPRPDERLEEHYSILEDKFANHEVIAFIRNMDTPVFLGLERQQVSLNSPSRAALMDRERDMRLMRAETTLRGRRESQPRGILGSSLLEVQFFIQNSVRRIRAAQDEFNQELRSSILLSAFDYNPLSGFFSGLRQQSDRNISQQLARITKQLSAKRKQLEGALANLGVPNDELQAKIAQFFERLDVVVQEATPQKVVGPTGAISDQVIELAINKPLLDRVINLVTLLDSYSKKIDNLWQPIRRFLALVNRFFNETGKELDIDPVGYLVVKIPGQDAKSLEALSSGERQIVVLLGHLSMNASIKQDGIFIIDEPELSLHLKWQEIFVESLLEAAPSNQFIFATHAPTIVSDYPSEKCIDTAAH